MGTGSDRPDLHLTDLARVIARVAAQCRTAPQERAVLRRVSLRPVEGVRVWRTPVAAAVAGGGDPASCAREVASAVRGSAQVRQVRLHGAFVDIELCDPARTVPPRQGRHLRAWGGVPQTVEIDLPAIGARSDRARLWGEAVASIAAACGDRSVLREGEPGMVGVRLAGTDPVHRRVAAGVFSGTAPDTDSGGPLGQIVARSAPAQAAWLGGPASEPVVSALSDMWARDARSPGFIWAHARQVAEAAAVHEATGGTERLLIDLAAYPFVQENALARADAAVLARHVLRIARQVRETVWRRPDAAESGPVPAASAALVLAHGMRALGIEPPTRI